MKNKLTAALCLVLCILVGGSVGYIAGNPEYRYGVLSALPGQWEIKASKPQLVADAETASALAEEYYRKNFDPQEKDPRLAEKARYIPQIQAWFVYLMPENYVLASRESFSTLASSLSGSYMVEILAGDGTIVGIHFD